MSREAVAMLACLRERAGRWTRTSRLARVVGGVALGPLVCEIQAAGIHVDLTSGAVRLP